jgi:hypothetical protein
MLLIHNETSKLPTSIGNSKEEKKIDENSYILNLAKNLEEF